MPAASARRGALICLLLWACSPPGNRDVNAPGGDGQTAATAEAGTIAAGDRLAAQVTPELAPATDPAATATAESGDADDPALELATRASELTRQGEFATAVPLWREVRDRRAAELGADHELTGRAWNNLSFALAGAGEFEQALEAATRSVAIAGAAGQPTPRSAMAHTQLANVAERLGQLELAWDSAEAACRAFEVSYGKTPMTGDAHELAGRLARRMGDLQGAETHFHWALAIAERTFGLSDPVKACRPMVLLAGVLASGGRVDGALQLLEQASLTLERAGLAGGEEWSACVSTRVSLLEGLGERELAAGLLETLIARGDPGTAGERGARLGQAQRFVALGDPQRALAALPLPAIASGVPPAESAAIAAVQAEIERLRGRPAAALEILRPALALPGVEDDLAATPLHLAHGRVLRELGDEQSVEVLLALFRRLRAALGEDHPLQVEPLLALTAAELDAHGATLELLDALDMTHAALAGLLPERTAALLCRSGSGLPGDLLAAHLAVAAARPERAAATFASVDGLRETALLEASAWWIARGAATRSSALLELLEARGEDGALRIAPAQRADLRARMSDTTGRLRAQRSPWVELLAPRGAGLAEARTLLAGDDERLLLTSWAGDVLWAQVVGPDAAHDRLVDLGPTAPLAKLLSRAQADLRQTSSPCDLGPLAAVLLEPLWEELAGCTRVLIVADGPLAFLPFEALPVPEPGAPERFWGESCRLAYGTSVRRLLRLADTPTEARAGGVHVQQSGVFRDRPVPDRLVRLRGRFRVTPSLGAATGDAPVLPADELTLWRDDALESALAARGDAGGLGDRRFVELVVPGYVDASVPTATALVLGPEPDDDRAVWEREDGLLLPHEIAELPLDVDVVLLPMLEVGPDPAAPDLRPAGLHALVASTWEAGARQVLVSGWSRLGPPRPDFDRMLMQRLRQGDPTTALWDTQQAWLTRARERGDEALLHPGLWARLRAFGL